MYCSACNEALARGLNYCNNCGTKLNEAKENAVAKPAELFPESLVWAIVTVFIVGLGSITGLMAVMKQALHFPNEWILGITLVVFLLFLAVESVLIWLLVSGRRGVMADRHTESLTGNVPKELPAADPQHFGEPVPSVTDRTTRKFDPVYREQK